ncbi:hypothetical protein L2E82_28010 [Cichorium intybus]|uniref:Uncharacterized protein n=1 Tax=Cichorium intybus TaxID=13427 RepID=A0ACB9CUK9_CICIN|nr:hypothetical protein L2E82_28010 [Cichorium intybus]
MDDDISEQSNVRWQSAVWRIDDESVSVNFWFYAQWKLRAYKRAKRLRNSLADLNFFKFINFNFQIKHLFSE